MRLLIEPSEALPLVTLGITFRAGRADEPAGRAGLARVCSKMIRRRVGGSEEIEHRLDAVGAELGEHVGLGTTTIGCEVLARSVQPAAELMAELMANPCADPAELGRVVRRSKAALIRSRDDDALLCSRAMRRHLFADHPHGDRVLGTVDGLDAVSPDDVVAFIARGYTQQNAIVHVSGAISESDAESVADTLLAALPEGAALAYPASEPAPPKARRLCIVDKQDRNQTQLGIGTLGARADDEDYFALLLANAAFGGTFTSRMTREIRSERGWSYGASSQVTVGRVREAFTMWTAPSIEDAADCLALELELLDAWHRDGISAEELDQCRKFLARSYAFEIDTPSKRLQQKLDRALLGLPDDFHEQYLDRLEEVTLDQANAAVARRIFPDNLWISAVGDSESLTQDIARTCGDAAEVVVESVDVP